MPTKGRVRTGYQIFSSQIWLRVKSEMASGNFAEISREIGNQVNQYLPSFFSRDSSCSSSSKKTENPFMIFKNTFFFYFYHIFCSFYYFISIFFAWNAFYLKKEYVINFLVLRWILIEKEKNFSHLKRNNSTLIWNNMFDEMT